MRRKEREVADLSSIEEIIDKAEFCNLGLSLNNKPYVVPLNFGYKNKTFYFHAAKEGKKIEYLKQNPEVFIQITADHKIIEKPKANQWTAHYKSIMASGKAYFVEDYAEKLEALDSIMLKYSGKSDWEYPKKVVDNTLIFKIEISEFSAKESS